MMRSDGKRPDGATVLPFEAGLPKAWDATIFHTCASSHLHSTAVEAGSGAAAAEARKDSKYAALNGRAQFRAVAIETLDAFGPSARRLFDEIADRIKSRTGDACARSHLYARIAAVVQTGNCVHYRSSLSQFLSTLFAAITPFLSLYLFISVTIFVLNLKNNLSYLNRI